MGNVRLYGATSGYTELAPPAVAPDGVLSLPSGTGTLLKETEWTDFTPTWTTSGGTTIAATVNYARYTQIGKSVFAQVALICTTGGGSGYFRATLPVAASAGPRIIGSTMYMDSGTAFYSGTCLIDLPTRIVFVGYGEADYIGGAPAITAAAGDVLRYSVNYEVA